MEIEIKDKIEQFSTDVQNLFEESITCYRVKAYRASLLFSYLGFLTMIKERIISSKIPNGIQQSRWDKILRNVNKEDLWEKEVFTEIVNSGNPIFNISDTIRQQVKYWKDRRNDCAHFKENEINNYHIESFWAFIKSNISKITIEGGEANLIKKFIIHFDETKTPPGSSYLPLINEIEYAVEIENLTSFFKELHKEIVGTYWYNNDEIAPLYADVILEIKNRRIKEEFLKFIKSVGRNLDLYIIWESPQTFSDFKYSDNEVREIWKKRAFQNKNLVQGIYSAFYRNKIIPNSQMKESAESFFNYFNQSTYNNLSSDSEIKKQIANQHMLEKINEYYFKDEGILKLDYKEINAKADLISLFLEYGDINEDTVLLICKIYEKGINPYWLSSNLKEVFKKRNDIKDKFNNVCKNHSRRLPSELE
ncbi:hypothetical protein [Lewinella cohaerens]|uniref:hypothetical protein n=1 Tax=Lewinella cohaerens TaxID=70995 RepID=UPI00037B89CE|nr:hypothetical protein [Lewinella cohaerens]